MDVSLDEILIFEKNQLVSYAFINDSDELKKLKIEENKIKYTDQFNLYKINKKSN